MVGFSKKKSSYLEKGISANERIRFLLSHNRNITERKKKDQKEQPFRFF